MCNFWPQLDMEDEASKQNTNKINTTAVAILLGWCLTHLKVRWQMEILFSSLPAFIINQSLWSGPQADLHQWDQMLVCVHCQLYQSTSWLCIMVEFHSGWTRYPLSLIVNSFILSLNHHSHICLFIFSSSCLSFLLYMCPTSSRINRVHFQGSLFLPSDSRTLAITFQNTDICRIPE